MRRNRFGVDVQQKTSRTMLSCAQKRRSETSGNSSSISAEYAVVSDGQDETDAMAEHCRESETIGSDDTESTVGASGLAMSTKSMGRASSCSSLIWRTPQGTVASKSYITAVQQATINWWYANRRNDLPWRQENNAVPAGCETSDASREFSRSTGGGTYTYCPTNGRFMISCTSSVKDTPVRRPCSPTQLPLYTKAKISAKVEENVWDGDESVRELSDTPIQKWSQEGGQHNMNSIARTNHQPPDPYAIWVSEVMSQQTQMNTVIAYFKTWMCKFPTVEALAAASEAEVRAVWAGMGYYRRALYLLNGARFVVDLWRKENHSGPAQLPATAAALQAVPGIGPYTAAAIASICYREPAIAVDGNLVRVLSRLRAESDFDPKKPQNIKIAFQWGDFLMKGDVPADAMHGSVSGEPDHLICDGNAKETDNWRKQTKKCRVERSSMKGTAVKSMTSIVTTGREHNVAREDGLLSDALGVCQDPGALNQGLMEIGARVCKPNGAPLCGECPLQAYCGAYAALKSGAISSIEGIIPLRSVAQQKRVEHVVCVVHEFSGMGKSVKSLSTSAPKQKKGVSTSRGHKESLQEVLTKSEDDCGRERAFIVVQRPENVLLGGMLEFPSLSVDSGDCILDEERSGDDKKNKGCRKRKQQQTPSPFTSTGVPTPDLLAHLAHKLGCVNIVDGAPSPQFVGQVSHIFSHIDMTVHVFHCHWNDGLECGSISSFQSSSPLASNQTEEMDDTSRDGGIAERLCTFLAETLAKANTCEENIETRKTSNQTRARTSSKIKKNKETLQGKELVDSFRKRISVLRESEMKKGACSRLMLKVMEEVSRGKSQRTSPLSTHEMT